MQDSLPAGGLRLCRAGVEPAGSLREVSAHVILLSRAYPGATIVRYNRLIDTFLGLTTYSLQNHLRTTVKGMGQIEIDELYIGLDKHGCHYVIPVQAKGGKDRIGIVQTAQDIRFVEERFPEMRCRAIAAQFMEDRVVALFELTLRDEEIKVIEERHYRLVPGDKLDDNAIRAYRS